MRVDGLVGSWYDFEEVSDWLVDGSSGIGLSWHSLNGFGRFEVQQASEPKERASNQVEGFFEVSQIFDYHLNPPAQYQSLQQLQTILNLLIVII
jgi:hypothetical protein